MQSTWEDYEGKGCDPTPVNNERKLEEHEIRLDKLEDRCKALEQECRSLRLEYQVQFLYTLSTLRIIADITKDEVTLNVVNMLQEKIEKEMKSYEQKK